MQSPQVNFLTQVYLSVKIEIFHLYSVVFSGENSIECKTIKITPIFLRLFKGRLMKWKECNFKNESGRVQNNLWYKNKTEKKNSNY